MCFTSTTTDKEMYREHITVCMCACMHLCSWEMHPPGYCSNISQQGWLCMFQT